MQILLCMRNKTHRTKNTSIFILNLFALQFISLIALSRLGPFYIKIASCLLIFVNDKFGFSPTVIIMHLGFNILMVLLLIVIQVFKNFRHRNFIIMAMGHTILNFKYIFLIPVGCVNIYPLVNGDTSVEFKVCCAFNMVFTFLLSAIELYTNWSNRFIEKDFCNRRQNSILCLFFQFGFVFSTVSFSSLVGAVFLMAVSIFRAYQVAITVEYQLIQSSTFFYSSLNIYICIICLVGTGKLEFLDLTCKLIIGVLVSAYFSKKFCDFINTWYGNNKSLYRINKPEIIPAEDQVDKDLKAESEVEIQQQNKSPCSYKDLIIMSRMFLSRKEMLEPRGKINPNNEWYLWWEKYTILQAFHRINCLQDKCQCKKGKKANENKLIMEDMRQLMINLEEQQKSVDIRIMGIYLNIEITDKPLKAYFEIIKMKGQEISVTNFIDLQVLILETRQCFSKIFLINKIQNSGLPLMKIIRFEELIESLQQQLKMVLEATINFNDLFASSSVKINQIVSDSKKIFEIKDRINSKLEDLVVNYSDSVYVNFIIFLYYQYLEVYKSKQKELKIISQQKNLKRRLFEKDDQDIFSPDHGVIYIDMVEERGKIKKLTKNICELYGHNYEDMVSFNINQFMPQIFGKHHHKFLTNFIELGKIKILSEKKRLVFAKSKNKYIFPIIVRMKTEHLLSTEFGVTALVKKLETTSEFILFGANGKIQQMTQKIYKILFYQNFRAEIDKSRRMCLLKMIPNLIRIINDPSFQENPQKVYESLIIFSTSLEIIDKFKIYREPKHSSLGRTGSSPSYAGGSTIDLEQTSDLSMTGTSLNVGYHAEVFKAFLSDLNFVKLHACTISYKVTKVRTQQFAIFQLEIISIDKAQNPFETSMQQYKKLAEHLNIYDEHEVIGQNFEKFRDVLQRNDVLNFMFNKNVELDKYNNDNNNNKRYKASNDQIRNKKKIRTVMKDDNENENQQNSLPDSSVANNFNDMGNNLANQDLLQRGGSERSSVTDQNQNQSKKQMLINAFNCDNCGINSKFLTLINLLIVGVFAVLLALVIKTIQNVKSTYASELHELMTIKAKQVYEYRLANLRTQQFYTILQNRNFTVDDSYFKQLTDVKNILNNDFTSTILAVKKLNEVGVDPGELYQNVTVYDSFSIADVSLTGIQLLNLLDYKFREDLTQEVNSFLKVNYINIHNWFKKMIELNADHASSSNQNKDILTIFGVYQFGCLVVALVWIPVLYVLSKQEKRILNLLSTMNVKQLKRFSHKLRLLLEYIKQGKLSQINSVMALLTDQKVQTALELEKQKSIVRNIRLVSQNGSYTVKPKLVALFIISFIVIFSLLPVVYYISLVSDEAKYQQTLSLIKLTSDLSDKAPMMINLYLTNVNNVYNQEPVLIYPQQMYDEAQTNYYNLEKYIASLTELANALMIKGGQDQKFTQSFCLQIPCTVTELSIATKFYDEILSLRNIFAILQPSKLNLVSKLNEQSLDALFVETSEVKNVHWVSKLYRFADLWSNRFKARLQTQLSATNLRLIIIGVILIPIYLMLMIYSELKLTGKMARVLKDAESVHMHFPVQILAENTYLTSYFNDKIKNNK